MKLIEFLKENLDKVISENRIKNFLEENNIDYQEYSNSYEIYDENKAIIVKFEKIESGYWEKNIIIKDYKEKSYPTEMKMS